jgi:DNA-binding NarL/FixJ family response regulator
MASAHSCPHGSRPEQMSDTRRSGDARAKSPRDASLTGGARFERKRTLGDAVRARAGLLAGHREGRNVEELARDFGFSVKAAEEIIRLENGQRPTTELPADHRLKPSRPRPDLSMNEILGAVCLVADLTGDVPTSETYSRRAADLGLPSLTVVCAAFGTWAGALRAVGVTGEGRPVTDRLAPSPANRTDAWSDPDAPCQESATSKPDATSREPLEHRRIRHVRELIADALLARPERPGEAAYDETARHAPQLPIERAGMSVRTSNALLRVGVHTLGDAARLTADELKQIPHLGAKALRELSETLQKHRLDGPAQAEPASYPKDADPHPTTGRNAEIIALRRQGHSLAEIASQYGITRARVGQIVNRSTTGEEAAQARRAQQLEAARAAADRLRAGFREGRSAAELAKVLGLATAAVESVLRSTVTPFDRAERRRRLADRRRAQPTYSEAELIRAVNQVAERLGGVPRSSDYHQFARELGLPSLPTVMNRLGGWSAAVRAAGMTPHPSRRSGYSRRWTDDACRRALEALIAELGELPTAAQYDVLASADDSLPSLATVRNRLGRWSEVAAGLMATPHQHPILRRLGVSSEASDSERDETVWLAHLAGEVSDAELIELTTAELFAWDPSYGPPPDV